MLQHVRRIAVPTVRRDDHHGAAQRTAVRCRQQAADAAAEVRSASEIEAHFKRNFDIEGTTIACEYLAARGLIGKAATPVRLTKISNLMVEELAFVHMGEVPDEF